jgi:hypothetical protein
MRLIEGTLVVQNLMNKKTEIQPSDITTLTSGLQACKTLKSGDAIVEAFEKYGLPSYESILKPSAPLEAQKPTWWENAGMWFAVGLMPPLLFVPKIRRKCYKIT